MMFVCCVLLVAISLGVLTGIISVLLHEATRALRKADEDFE